MRHFLIYLALVAAAVNFGVWQGSLNFAIGIVFLFQAYMIANDLPKD